MIAETGVDIAHPCLECAVPEALVNHAGIIFDVKG